MQFRGQLLQYELNADIVPLSKSLTKLPQLRRHKLVLIDESHNLRNREGKRYQVVRDYIERNDSRCVLLTATPYNKMYLDLEMYLDLGNQLRPFVDEKRDLGIRPERYFQTINELDFAARFQAPARSLTAFEKSEYPDDWRDLMRLFMVRRTRQFIIQNYAAYDSTSDVAIYCWATRTNDPVNPLISHELRTRIEYARKRVLNPMSHSQIVNTYSLEIKEAIDAVRELEKAISDAKTRRKDVVIKNDT